MAEDAWQSPSHHAVLVDIPSDVSITKDNESQQ
jgi:hypothetical protein